MSKKIILSIVSFIALVVLFLLLLTGCPHVDSLYGLKVTGDGAGGAIAVYEDELGGNVYVQKISPSGERMWGGNGVLLGETNSEFYSFQAIHVISTGLGGAIICWPEVTSREPPVASVYHVSKVDSSGREVWQKDFKRVGQIIEDGSGGVIIGHRTDGETWAMVRIDSNGDFPWGENEVPLPRPGDRSPIVSDGAGGAIAIWEGSQYPVGAEPGEARPTHSLFAQRVNTKGELLWGDGLRYGMLVYEFPEEIWIDSLQAVEDGAGGVLITWFQVTENPSAEPGHQQTWDVAVQRVDADGNVLWQPEGVPFDITGADPIALPMEPSLVSDGSGGAIVIWRDMRHDAEGEASVYAQRVGADGNQLWQAGGVKVSSTSLNPNPQIIVSSSGKAMISYSFWEDGEALHIQKLDSNGNTSWATNGVLITERGFSSQYISADGQDGVIIAWGVNKGLFSSEKAYLQRISADGKLMWGEDGIRLNP